MRSQVRSWHRGVPRPQDGNEGDACRYREYLESRTQPTRGSPHLEVGQSDVLYSKNQQVTKYGAGSRTWPDKKVGWKGAEWIRLAQDEQLAASYNYSNEP
jgi:hypothetical protein